MFNETLEKLIAQHGGNMAALGRALGVTGNYISMLRDKKRGGKPSAEFIGKVKEVFGIDILTGKSIVTEVTRETSPQVIPIREDVWQEIRTSNDFYRDHTKDLQAEKSTLLTMMAEKDRELLSMVREFLQGRIVPKQA